MPRPDPAWLDRQYDNRARVANSAEALARWAAASALVRDGMSRRLDIAYGDAPSETLDLFPATRAGSPVLVFLHGGWWRALDKSDHSFIAPTFTQAGATVVVPNYALCPSVGIETIALQMTKALAWTWRHIGRYGGDRNRIVVAGHSAGAHLAAMLLCCQWKQVGLDLPARLVGRALGISGVYDLEPLRRTTFLQPDLRLTPTSVRRLSPVHFPPPSGTMTLAVGEAESESFREQAEALRGAWGRRAVPALDVVPGADHFSVLTELVDPGAALNRRARELLGL